MFLNLQVIIASVGLDSFLKFLQVYYVLVENPDPYPPSFGRYLNEIAPTIGAEVNWTQSNNKVHSNFAETGKSIISRPFIGFFPLCIS